MDGLALVTFALYSISRWLVRGRQKIYGNQLAWLEYNLNLWNAGQLGCLFCNLVHTYNVVYCIVYDIEEDDVVR